MKRFYDRTHNRLVYIGQQSNRQFWDNQWLNSNLKKALTSKRLTVGQKRVLKYTISYVKKGGKVIDGGCGLGDKVHALQINGYDAYGVDYATDTIAWIHNYFPHLNVACEDIRSLPFENGYFDAYWSLGVMEHFYMGFDDVVSEMWRVLKDGGMLFITVPSMSLLRKFKSSLNCYPTFDNSEFNINKFYQFALNSDSLERTMNQKGFKSIAVKKISGFKGLSDEVPGTLLLTKVLFKCLHRPSEWLLSRFANHSTLFVFKKRANSLETMGV